MSIMNSQTNFTEEHSYATKNKEVNNDNYIDYEAYDCEPDQPDIYELDEELDYEQHLEDQRQSELYASIESISNIQIMLSDGMHAEKILQTMAYSVTKDIGECQYKHLLYIVSFFISEMKQRSLDAWKQYESLNP